MRAFAQLVTRLDHATRGSDTLAALEAYVRSTPPSDAAWALWFLSGQRLQRAVKPARLCQWTAEYAGIPLWLVEDCSEHVGDLAETLALLLPRNPQAAPRPLARLVAELLLPLAGATEIRQRSLLRAAWNELDTTQRFLWHKLVTGNFRVGISRSLLARALAALAGVPEPVMAHRLLGAWQPSADDLGRLLSREAVRDDAGRPYPFHLATPLEEPPHLLGDVGAWQVEWMWDGIRSQLIRRGGDVALWSRGAEFITASFPEIAEAARGLPEGTVLDGAIVAWRDDTPLPFLQVQRRLNRRAPTRALCREIPVVFMACDLLELDGADWRQKPLAERRLALEQCLQAAREQWGKAAAPSRSDASLGLTQGELFPMPTVAPPAVPPLRLSPLLPAASWEQMDRWQQQARSAGAAGVVLKRRDSSYASGRERGAWWKWKVAPFTCNAVLVAAQPGHERGATRFTDYTFAVWDGPTLVPVARACGGLTDEEVDAVDAFVRAHATGRFGPVRSVSPELVFELAFDGITRSTRHRGGLAMRSPRIARWQQDKRPAEADTLVTLQRLAGEGVAG